MRSTSALDELTRLVDPLAAQLESIRTSGVPQAEMIQKAMQMMQEHPNMPPVSFPLQPPMQPPDQIPKGDIMYGRESFDDPLKILLDSDFEFGRYGSQSYPEGSD